MFPAGTGTGPGGTSGPPGWTGVPFPVGLPTLQSFGPPSFPQWPVPPFPLQSATVAGPFYVKSGSGALEYVDRTWSTGDRLVVARAENSSAADRARSWVWECTISGASTGTPVWPTTTIIQDVTTVTQNGVVWTARKPGYPGGTSVNWAYATTYIDYLRRGSGQILAAGDDIYVSNNHSASWTTPPGLGTNTPSTATKPVRILCVNDAAAPPTALATTAAETITDTVNAMTLNQTGGLPLYYYGITFSSARTNNGDAILLNDATDADSCSFRLTGASGAADIQFQTSRFKSCTFKFANATQFLAARNDWWRISGGSLLAGGVSPTNLFGTTQMTPGYMENFDLSNAASTINLFNASGAPATGGFFRKIKMPSAWTGALSLGAMSQGAFAELYNCDSAGTNYVYHRQTDRGDIFHETTLVRTGGSSDGTTVLSWRMVTLANAGAFPIGALVSGPIEKWNDTTGSSVTATIEFLHDNLIQLNNNEIWMELRYSADAGDPLGAIATSAMANVFSTPAVVPASVAAWTTTGMTNPNTQKMSVTFTPQLKGPLYAIVYLDKASYTVYVDRLITLS